MHKRYTAQEMRSYADAIAGDLRDNDPGGVEYFYDDLIPVVEALRQSADILDSIRNEISVIEKMPTANLDGSFENQKVNGERLMAKLAFYDKTKEIASEVPNG